jgi:glycerate kinase
MAEIAPNRYGKIVVAVDKFKGTLTALQAAQAIREGLGEALPDADIRLFPMADGGDGSMDVVQSCKGGEIFMVNASDPLGREVQAPILKVGDTVFIEMAKISGLALVAVQERDILHSTTYGLGQLLRYAIEEIKTPKVVLAIGGSATNDGGVGMLEALGFRYDPASNIFDDTEVSNVTPHLWDTEIEVACDVENPLLGPNGATAVYGRQKGAQGEDFRILEQRLSRWSEAVSLWRNVPAQELAQYPGAGAAGGVGFALHAVLGAKMLSGWKVFTELMGLPQEIASADLVITGEGRFDRQSLEGKLPLGIAQLCAEYKKPLWLVCGRNVVSEEICRSHGRTRRRDRTTGWSVLWPRRWRTGCRTGPSRCPAPQRRRYSGYR